MNKTNVICLLFLSIISFSGFSQNNLSDWEQEKIEEQALIEASIENDNYFPNNFISTDVVTSVTVLSDLDDDGMDDTWEVSHNLDPTDPKDAWGDEDNDQVLNLFEFQLETDPNNENSPLVYELTPSDGESALDDLIEAAENDIRVIRLAQGDYDAKILAVYYENFKVMIQGGWNDDFSIYNPSQYPTNWSAVGDEALNILIPVGNETITKSTIILDGINFMATEYFSLAGAAKISIYSGKSAISIHNCTMTNSTYYGLSLGHKGNTDSVNVFITNTIIGNNLKGGIYTQVVDDSYGRWRIFNTTINNSESEKGGIDGLTLSEGELKIELTNTINWGNTNYSFNFSSWHDVEISAINSNIDEAEPSVSIMNLSNSINANPLFENVIENNWALSVGSPCLDTGIDVGLNFSGAAPEMGAIETIVISSTKESAQMEDINVFPNPVQTFLYLDLGIVYKNVKLELININGQQVAEWKYDQIRNTDLDLSSFAKGIYFLSVFSENNIGRVKVIKE